jgi:hypothetical protein
MAGAVERAQERFHFARHPHPDPTWPVPPGAHPRRASLRRHLAGAFLDPTGGSSCRSGPRQGRTPQRGLDRAPNDWRDTQQLPVCTFAPSRATGCRPVLYDWLGCGAHHRRWYQGDQQFRLSCGGPSRQDHSFLQVPVRTTESLPSDQTTNNGVANGRVRIGPAAQAHDSLRWPCPLDLSLCALQDCGTGRVSIRSVSPNRSSTRTASLDGDRKVSARPVRSSSR